MDTEEIRDKIPEIEAIKSESLQRKVVEAWSLAIEVGEYDSLEAVPGLPMVDVDNLRHTRGVTNLARSIAETVAATEGAELDFDTVTAGAICHDLGKVIEYTELDDGQWIDGTWENSNPTVRHSVYSVAFAWSLDFPKDVVHVIGSHSLEGEHVIRNQEAAIVSTADSMWWELVIPELTGQSKSELL